MNPDPMHTSWKRIRHVLERAGELDGDALRAYLDSACAGDAELRAHVDELLALEPRSLALEPPMTQGLELERGVPARIGAYRIEHEIGSGGMGSVYAAVREGPRLEQRVALKLVKLGMDTRELLKRFERERAVLAALQHDGIARFLDAGATASGRPYLVMELVEGQPIDRWCDERRLGLRARIELVLRVCDALQHAHERLVVHRDIKPSNILVHADGGAKLLDFGLAKLVAGERDDSLHDLTQSGVQLLTPAYASPEQLRGELVGVATDVYSLGVVLHELLVGTRPRTEASPNAAPGERPSTRAGLDTRAAQLRSTSTHKLRAALRGDLDTILLKALHPEIARRYASVSALAQDLRRYLAGLPVAARPDSWAYRTTKFVQRHRLLLGASSAIAVALVVSAVWSYRESRAAEAARRLADQRLARALAIATTFTADVTERLRKIEGTSELQREVLRKSIGQLDELARESGSDARVRVELAWAYLSLGEVLGSDPARNLGQPAEALELFEQARVIADEVCASDPAHANARQAGFLARFRSGMVHFGESRARDALAAFEAAEREARLGAELSTDPVRFGRSVWIAACKVGLAHAYLDDLPAARAAFDRAETRVRALLQQASAPTGAQEDLGDVLSERCELDLNSGDFARAASGARQALDVYDELLAREPGDLQRANNRAMASARLARALALGGDARAAAPHLEATVAHYERLFVDEPNNDFLRLDLADHCSMLAGWALEHDDPEAARAWVLRCIELRGEPADELARLQRAETSALEAWAALALGCEHGELAFADAWSECMRASFDEHSCSAGVQLVRASALLALGRAHSVRAERESALELLNAAREAHVQCAAVGGPAGLIARRLASIEALRARAGQSGTR
jgi:eukaryotic-like serine/threonine-protein kinase